MTEKENTNMEVCKCNKNYEKDLAYRFKNTNKFFDRDHAKFCLVLRKDVSLQPVFNCSKLIIETLGQGVKYVQS